MFRARNLCFGTTFRYFSKERAGKGVRPKATLLIDGTEGNFLILDNVI
jgi:hypothetical protein